MPGDDEDGVEGGQTDEETVDGALQEASHVYARTYIAYLNAMSIDVELKT